MLGRTNTGRDLWRVGKITVPDGARGAPVGARTAARRATSWLVDGPRSNER
jgi:hypothetical protein